MPYPTGIPKWRRHLRFWRSDVAADVDDELRFHFEAREEELRARGVPDDEIARAVAAEFGDVDATRRALREIGARVARRRERRWWWHRLVADLRYTLRGIRRTPGFAVAVIVTLALGIGANAAIFSAVDRLLLRPPPLLRDPARAHRVYLASPNPDGVGEFVLDAVPYGRFVDLTAWAPSLARTALATSGARTVGAGADARALPVGVVTAGFFGFFDAPPALGRYFAAAEDAPPSGTPVVVLSWATWQTRYGGRHDVLGTTLRIDDVDYTVVGVARRGFAGLWPERPPVAYVPLSVVAAAGDQRSAGETWWTTRTRGFAVMLAERKPGIAVAAANADLTAAMRRSWAAEGGAAEIGPRAIAASILPERGPLQTSTARVAALVGAMALVVLLIACANVANLLLARALRRRREIAVRLALGVGRGRLLSHLLVESVLLALAGGAAGLLVAPWGGAVLRAAIVPPGDQAPVLGDARTLAFVGIAALLAGLLTGLAGAWQARHVDVTRDLRAGAREGRRHRSRARVTLLVAQGALSVLLLVGAGLFVRSLTNARRLRLGFDPAPVLLVAANLGDVRLDGAGAAALRERLLAAARRLPEVEHAALAADLPLDGNMWAGGLDVPDADPAARRRFHQMYRTAVSPDYFATLGTRIVRGRGIAAEDVAGGARVAVVSQAMAALVWPGQEALGRCLKVRDPRPGGRPVGRPVATPCSTVVGIAEDVKVNTLADDPGLYYYLAAAQLPDQWTGVVVRARGAGAMHAEAVRRALQREMPGASTVDVMPYAALVGEQTRSWQLGATMFVVFGGLALALAAVGLYGVVSYDVAQMAHEMGVRIALGARPAQVAWIGVRRGVMLGGLGIAIGGASALVLGGRLAPLLLGVSPRDPLVHALVAAAMLAVAAVASWVPARRAGRADPTVTLRAE